MFKIIVRSILFLLFVSGCGYFLFVIQKDNSKDDVQSGVLEYTCNCGWINWDHAIPTGPKKLILEFVQDSLTTAGGKTQTLTYSQSMKMKVAGLFRIVFRLTRKYEVNKGLTEEQRAKAAYFIFMQTSEAFEEMQGKMMFTIGADHPSSSFRDGDLMGDRIAFYRALKNWSRRDVAKWCIPVKKDLALQLLRKNSFVNRSWMPHYVPPAGVFPKQLSHIQWDSVLISENVKFLSQAENIFIE